MAECKHKHWALEVSIPEKLKSAIGNEVFVPAIDEDLTSYRAVSEALSSAECSVEALPSIARTLAALHSKTRHPGDELKRDDRKRELAARVFATEPGARASNTDELSSAFKACDETVTHGNFSDDSVLVDGSGDVKVVDWSHSCTGPRSFDVGCFVASLFLLYYRHEAANERQAMYSLVDGCKHFVQTYVESLPQEWRPADGSQFYSDVAGYAGVWLAYRLLRERKEKSGGAEGEEEKPCAREEEKPCVREDMLQAASRLVASRRNVTNADRLVFIGFILC